MMNIKYVLDFGGITITVNPGLYSMGEDSKEFAFEQAMRNLRLLLGDMEITDPKNFEGDLDCTIKKYVMDWREV